MPDGGLITVEADNRSLDERSAAERDMRPGPYVAISVSDTGTGMTADVQAKAFEPFFTTKPLGMGTGLGLSMIYGFAQQSGGQVRIHSQVHQGTTVSIYLPRNEAPQAADERRSATASIERAERTATVLVVDDEPSVRVLVAEVLDDAGYEVLEAEHGPSGLAMLRARPDIDLLVTDVGLPGGMNGRQLADAARVARPELKVLFITGYAENAVVGRGQLEAGMALLTKPFDVVTLGSKVAALLAAKSTSA